MCACVCVRARVRVYMHSSTCVCWLPAPVSKRMSVYMCAYVRAYMHYVLSSVFAFILSHPQLSFCRFVVPFHANSSRRGVIVMASLVVFLIVSTVGSVTVLT